MSSDPPPWPWPDHLDGLIAAAESHRVLVGGEGVRVLEVIVRSGAREPPHTHRHASVMIVDRPARLRYYDADGEAVELEPSDTFPKAQLLAPEGLHAVENLDDHDYHAFRVEFDVSEQTR